MSQPRTVVISLGKTAVDSRVFIDDQEITSSVVGVEVRAFVGKSSTVKLTLSARVEIIGEAGEVQFIKP